MRASSFANDCVKQLRDDKKQRGNVTGFRLDADAEHALNLKIPVGRRSSYVSNLIRQNLINFD